MTAVDTRRTEISSEFADYVEAVRRIQSQYRRDARRSTWFSNAISIALISTGSAVGLTGLGGYFPVQLSAVLGFAVVVLEGASRVFKPLCHAVHARQAAHALEHQLRLFAVGARPYTCSRREAQLKFVDAVEKILLRAYVQEDGGGQEVSGQTSSSESGAEDDKRLAFGSVVSAA
jgi:hypothetical protein